MFGGYLWPVDLRAGYSRGFVLGSGVNGRGRIGFTMKSSPGTPLVVRRHVHVDAWSICNEKYMKPFAGGESCSDCQVRSAYARLPSSVKLGRWSTWSIFRITLRFKKAGGSFLQGTPAWTKIYFLHAPQELLAFLVFNSNHGFACIVWQRVGCMNSFYPLVYLSKMLL
jgi:hypothetical protein